VRDPERVFLVTERLRSGPRCHTPGKWSRDGCGKSDPHGALAPPYSLSRSSCQKDADHPWPVALTMVCNLRENLVISLTLNSRASSMMLQAYCSCKTCSRC